MASEHCPGLKPQRLVPQADVIQRLLDQNSTRVHPGLLFDRYLPLLKTRHLGQVYELLREFIRRYSKLEAWGQPLVQQQLERMATVIEHRSGEHFSLSLESPLVLGLGLGNYTDNGFLFDPVVGVPWLPGTAVKGLCRRGAQLVGTEPEEQQRLLGPIKVDAETGPAVGDLVFFDAWPESWPKLEIQVINPHYRSYYDWLNGEPKEGRPPPEKAPHGLDDPVPIYHLSVSQGTSYRFAILSRSKSKEAVMTAREWLETALACLGAGGRTALGYGAFEGAWEEW